MKTTLTHHFLSVSYDLEGLLTGNRTLADFVKKLKKQSLMHPNRHEPAKYLGDGFELFG